jgi:hypothetical protein
MRSFLVNHDQVAVSANLKEAAINTEQTLDTSLLVDLNTMLDLDYRREDNSDELTGKEEPDAVYDLGTLLSKPLVFSKAQAQHFAFLLSFGLGVSTPAAWGGGYKHAITPITGMDLPGFTAAQRYGKTINKRRFASCFVDTLKATFAKDSWAKIEAGLKGTGKFTDSVITEKVTATFDAVLLTLAANGVQGSTAAERLDNVQRIRVQAPTTGEWIEVVYTAVDANTPAQITIVAPGGTTDSVTYEILYAPIEAAWCTFPARVSETPLRVTDLLLKLGGTWDGSAFNGGRTLSSEVESFEWNLNNQALVEFRIGGTGNYANYMMRQGRMQTIALNRQMREFILQQAIKDNEHFGVYAKATGAEFETGKNFYVELVWPSCGVLKAPVSANGKIIAEAGDLKVLEDGTYGSVLAWVGNEVSGYAQ